MFTLECEGGESDAKNEDCIPQRGLWTVTPEYQCLQTKIGLPRKIGS